MEIKVKVVECVQRSQIVSITIDNTTSPEDLAELIEAQAREEALSSPREWEIESSEGVSFVYKLPSRYAVAVRYLGLRKVVVYANSPVHATEQAIFAFNASRPSTGHVDELDEFKSCGVPVELP